MSFWTYVRRKKNQHGMGHGSGSVSDYRNDHPHPNCITTGKKCVPFILVHPSGLSEHTNTVASRSDCSAEIGQRDI